MTPRFLSLALVATAALGVADARAQALYNQPGRPNLGGGLIELLMTGREPGAGPMREAPALSALPEDPFADPAPRAERRRMAALPSGAAVASIARETAPEYRRQVVAFDGREAPGTIVVDTPSRFLYLVQPGGQAIRYGIGVGRPGFEWAGMI
jgi:lipoprotein-anchoring transpeptidase ErfK/SrfK